MTVAELIKQLKKLPQNISVSVNDESNGIFHEVVEEVFDMPESTDGFDKACIILVVNGV